MVLNFKKLGREHMQEPLPDFVLNARLHHSITLPDGRVIKGDKSLAIMQDQYLRTFEPFSLHGKSVVDLGTWTGAFAVEAARRGASRIVGVDHFMWKYPGVRKVFQFVTQSCGYDIPDVECDLDASPLDLSSLGKFDISLFLGVFYHLKDPIAAIREIAKITREVLVIETYWAADLPSDLPLMAFYPGRELANDPSNWWAPNIPCVVALLKTFGFPEVVVSDGSGPNRKMFHAYKRVQPHRFMLGPATATHDGWDIINHWDMLQRSVDDLKNEFAPTAPTTNFVTEHWLDKLSETERRIALVKIYALLSPAGRCRIAIPDPMAPDIAIRPTEGNFPRLSFEILSNELTSCGFSIEPLEWFDEEGRFQRRPWNPADGMISRSADNDPRNSGGKLRCTSIIVDAFRPS
jgi:tRNA (mo5U34)-methyltransferase